MINPEKYVAKLRPISSTDQRVISSLLPSLTPSMGLSGVPIQVDSIPGLHVTDTPLLPHYRHFLTKYNPINRCNAWFNYRDFISLDQLNIADKYYIVNIYFFISDVMHDQNTRKPSFGGMSGGLFILIEDMRTNFNILSPTYIQLSKIMQSILSFFYFTSNMSKTFIFTS